MTTHPRATLRDAFLFSTLTPHPCSTADRAVAARRLRHLPEQGHRAAAGVQRCQGPWHEVQILSRPYTRASCRASVCHAQAVSLTLPPPMGSFFAHLFAAEHVGESSFNLTETNPFKQLTHLSLRCRAGNDTAVKKYLLALRRRLILIRNEWLTEAWCQVSCLQTVGSQGYHCGPEPLTRRHIGEARGDPVAGTLSSKGDLNTEPLCFALAG